MGPLAYISTAWEAVPYKSWDLNCMVTVLGGKWLARSLPNSAIFGVAMPGKTVGFSEVQMPSLSW